MTKICLGFLVFCGEFVVSVRQPRKQGRRRRKHRSFPQGKIGVFSPASPTLLGLGGFKKTETTITDFAQTNRQWH